MSGETGSRRRRMVRLRLMAMPLAFIIDAGQASAELRGGFAGALPAMMRTIDSDAAILPANQLTFSIEDVECVAGQAVPLKITLPQAAELARSDARLGAFILVHNLPTGVMLSAGVPSGGPWVLPLHEVAGLQLVAAPDAVGTFFIEFSLIGAGNKRLAQQTVRLNLLGFDVMGRVGTTSTLAGLEKNGNGAAAAVAPAPRAARLPLQEETELLKRGEELLRQGGIAAARIIFEELAQKSSSKGALALARSYDPAYIPNSRTSAVTPDLNKALAWYRRADQLGSAEAKERIAEIGTRR